MKKYKDNYVKKETEIKTILIPFNYTRKKLLRISKVFNNHGFYLAFKMTNGLKTLFK